MAASGFSTQQVKAESNRIARRARGFAKHRLALDQAIEGIDPDFEPAAWTTAFKSPDPAVTNKVMAVTGGYSTLVNNYAEIARAAARLEGVMHGRRPNIEQCLDGLVAKGALDADEAQMVKDLYGTEGKMEHLSPDLTAEEIHQAITRLRQDLPALMEKTLEWLEAQGYRIR